MAAVWYFLPGINRESVVLQDELSRSALREYGLDTVLDDVRRVPDHCLVMDITAGPGESAGTLLYPIPISGDIPKKPGYAPQRQAWRKTAEPAAGETVPLGEQTAVPWIGYEIDSPPRPADLERRQLIGGYPIQDAHGHTWQVPTLRAVDNPRGRLTASFSWDDYDRPRIGVDPKYAALWQRSAEVWDLIDHSSNADGGVFSQDFDGETDERLLAYLLDCLQINYRVNNAVFATLDKSSPGWLSQGCASWMLNATVDLFKYRAFLAAQKKTPS
jgi:hypothetical protein